MNEIMKLKESIFKPIKIRDLIHSITELFEHTERIYSYVLYNNSDRYTIVYHIAQNEKHNCIDVNCAKTNIINAVIGHKNDKGIISYEQPPLPILVKVLRPLVQSLTKQEHSHWSKQLTFEDIEQMCYLCICELYNKGYYIHKSLVATSLRNAIYYHLRADDHRGIKIVSLYVKQFSDNEKMMLLDTIKDEAASSIIDDKETEEVKNDIFNEQKQFIIDIIGKRQYDQLVREWTMNSTTGSSRKKVCDLRKEVNRTGMSDKAWVKYYE